MKNIYFISDAHLGCRATQHRRQQERRLVRFLDQIKDKAQAVYMLGDMFDFWFEYKTVVPRGFTRFLGKVSELTDMGVEVHYFAGNHDLWVTDYLSRECGVTLHRDTHTVELGDHVFVMGHGDGLGDPSRSFRLLRSVFRNSVCRVLFAALHPRWGVGFGLAWAKHSRLKHGEGGDPGYLGPDNEYLVQWAKHYMESHPEVNFFVFGHRHIELDERLSSTSRVLILGDWLTQFTYAVWDGSEMKLKRYVEGETKP